jgi:hypothetical protein
MNNYRVTLKNKEEPGTRSKIVRAASADNAILATKYQWMSYYAEQGITDPELTFDTYMSIVSVVKLD